MRAGESRSSGGDFDGAVIVAVTFARVVQMAVDDVVDVITMRQRVVSTPGTVRVIGGVACAGMTRRTCRGVGPVHGELVLVYVIAVHVVEVPIVKVVVVSVVLDALVAAAGAVNVGMVVVDGMAHGRCSSSS